MTTNSSSTLDLELYIKILELVCSDDSYYVITDHSIKSTLKHGDKNKMVRSSAMQFNGHIEEDRVHPEDRNWFVAISHDIEEFFFRLPALTRLKYKVNFNLRYLKADGQYTPIQQQYIILEQDEFGLPIKTLSLLTDLTERRANGEFELSFIGTGGEPSFYNVVPYPENIHSKEKLTYREKQVLRLLAEGKLSKEVGDILQISKQTVDTHRKNMLHKKHLCNTGELIGKAIMQGWI